MFAALSADQTVLGFGLPSDERAALIASEKFFWATPSDMRYQVGPRPGSPPSTTTI